MSLPPDDHVHTQWSWDTRERSSMLRVCEQALRIGLPSVAFTDHVDFTDPGEGDTSPPRALPGRIRAILGPPDVAGYLACVEECRDRFPGLRIRTGAECGEVHLFAGSAGRLLARGRYERVLGSLHTVVDDGMLVDAGALFGGHDPHDVMRRYLGEVHAMVTGSDLFEVLGHLDYPRRFWPSRAGAYDEARYEEEYRGVLRALAASGRVLEINTRSPLLSVGLLRWWREEGGRAVSFGSDAHEPGVVGRRFADAVAVASAAGFARGDDPGDFWRC